MMQSRPTRLTASFALLVLALLLGLIPAGRTGPAAGGHPLVILATASNRGEVDPCG